MPRWSGNTKSIVLGDAGRVVARVRVGDRDPAAARAARDHDEGSHALAGRPLDRERTSQVGLPGVKWSLGTASVTHSNRLSGHGSRLTNVQPREPGDADGPGEAAADGKDAGTTPGTGWPPWARATARGGGRWRRAPGCGGAPVATAAARRAASSSSGCGRAACRDEQREGTDEPGGDDSWTRRATPRAAAGRPPVSRMRRLVPLAAALLPGLALGRDRGRVDDLDVLQVGDRRARRARPSTGAARRRGSACRRSRATGR